MAPHGTGFFPEQVCSPTQTHVAENERTTQYSDLTCKAITGIGHGRNTGFEKERKVGEDLIERYWLMVPGGDELHKVLPSLCLIFNYVVDSTQIERAGKKLN